MHASASLPFRFHVQQATDDPTDRTRSASSNNTAADETENDGPVKGGHAWCPTQRQSLLKQTSVIVVSSAGGKVISGKGQRDRRRREGE